MPDNFIRSADGTILFTDGSPGENLAAILKSPDFTTGPTREEEKQEAEAAAITKADGDPAWTEASAIALRVIAAAEKLRALNSQQFANLKPAAYGVWELKVGEEFRANLIVDTEAVHQSLEGARGPWLPAALAMPVVNADLVAMQIRLTRLDHSTPTEAEMLVDDAVQRGDTAFLVAAGIDIRSWRQHRNSWRAGESREIVERILAAIDRATWTPARAVAAHVAERADQTAQAWVYLCNQLTAGKPIAVLDPMHRTSGALEPLLPQGSE